MLQGTWASHFDLEVCVLHVLHCLTIWCVSPFLLNYLSWEMPYHTLFYSWLLLAVDFGWGVWIKLKQLFEVNTGWLYCLPVRWIWSLLMSMEREQVSQTFVVNSTLIWLIASNDFSTFTHCKSFKSYIIVMLHIHWQECMYCVVSQLLSVWYLTVSVLYLLLHVGSLATLFMLIEPCLMYLLLQFRSRILIYTAGLFFLVFHNIDSRMVSSGTLWCYS